jgi:hemerythrin
LYSKFVRRNNLLDDITKLLERRDFLQRTWLFGEVVSTKTLNSIARECESTHFAAGEAVDITPETMGLVKVGQLGRYFRDQEVGRLSIGEFFGEERAVFWVPSRTTLKALEPTEALILPASLVAGIPSVRWRLFEEWGRRVNLYTEDGTQGQQATEEVVAAKSAKA